MKRGPMQVLTNALSLTRQGRLIEATAAIQDALGLTTERRAPAKSVPTTPNAPNGLKAIVDGLVRRSANEVVRGPVGERSTAPGPTIANVRPPDPPSATDVGPTGFVAGRFRSGTTSLDYKVYVPTRRSAPSALVVMLHGCTQGPDDFAAGTRMNEHAERDGFVVLYPAQSSKANASKCWNWFQPQDQHRGQGEAAAIADATRSIVARYDVDPARVYVAGLSAGGAMAAIVASEYPELFRAVGIHSGLPVGAATNVVDALTAMRSGATKRSASERAGRPVPTIVFHGDRDHTVNPINGDRIVLQAIGDVANAAAPRSTTGSSAGGRDYTKRTYTDEAGMVAIEQWVLHGAGHAWAGGHGDGTYTDPKGVDATAEMLRFFEASRANG